MARRPPGRHQAARLPVRWARAAAAWRPTRAQSAALALTAVGAATVAAVLVAPVGDPDDYEWPPPTSVAEPTRIGGGGVSPSPGPLEMPTIVPTDVTVSHYDPLTAASVNAAERTTGRCDRCGTRPETTSSVPPPTTTTATATPTSDPPVVHDDPAADRARMVADTNTARAELGCGPVAPHPDLDAQAQAHAQAMADDQAMYHSDGVTGFGSWAENVARGYGSGEVVAAWMDSPGHRANLADCSYVHLGVGYVDAPGGPYAVQQLAA